MGLKEQDVCSGSLQTLQLLALACLATWGSPLSPSVRGSRGGFEKRGGVLADLRPKERPGVEARVDCPKKHPFQEPGQELTLPLPASTLYVPEASSSG